MTVKDGIRKVYMLLDEYSTAGTVTEDEDIALKMRDFFDTAQRDVANFKPIRRTVAYPMPGAEGNVWLLPQDFGRLLRMWVDGETVTPFPICADKMLAKPEAGKDYILEYAAVPAPITPETPEGQSFEVDEDAAACMPFFVAAQCLLPDLVMDSGKLLTVYYQMRSALRDNSLSDAPDSSRRMRQSLWR